MMSQSPRRHGRIHSSGEASPGAAANGPQRIRYFVVVAFLTACLIGGGSARSDVVSLLYLRPAAAICIMALLLIPGRFEWGPVRVPLTLFAALTVIMLIQLLPLPPQIWPHVPGHARFVEAAAAAGIGQPWRSISIAPDRTLNSLAALSIPFATLVGMASLSREQRYSLLPLVMVAGALGALLSVAQMVGGAGGMLRLYRITNDENAVGFFANRNHQAVLLALMPPILTLWVALAPDKIAANMRLWLVIPALIFLLPLILVTGSRAGLGFFAVAFIAALLLFGSQIELHTPRFLSGKKWLLPAILTVIAIAAIIATIALARAEAVRRLLDVDIGSESRSTLLPLFFGIARDFFPFGSGFGTFDPVFRIFEPYSALHPRYLNHAHNDLIEIVIEGGLASALLMLGAISWVACKIAFVARRTSAPSRSVNYARLGALVIIILFAASAVDYPVRTPLMSALVVIACAWLGSTGSGGERRTRSADPAK